MRESRISVARVETFFSLLTEDSQTELLEDGHRRAVETRKRRKARKAAK